MLRTKTIRNKKSDEAVKNEFVRSKKTSLEDWLPRQLARRGGNVIGGVMKCDSHLSCMEYIASWSMIPLPLFISSFHPSLPCPSYPTLRYLTLLPSYPLTLPPFHHLSRMHDIFHSYFSPLYSACQHV